MRKLLAVLAGGALAVTLSAPAAHAAGQERSHVEWHHHHYGLVGRIVDDVLDWL
jgi:hypothetical protein